MDAGEAAIKAKSIDLRLGAGAIVALVALAVAAWLAFNPALFNDGDTGWHIATGRLILETGSVPDRDPFSFSMRGQPWTAHEWLADVAMAGLFRIGGWSALALLFAFAVAGTLMIAGRQLSRALPPRYVVVSLAGLVAVLAPSMLARPHVLAWPLIAAWLLLLLAARERRHAPPLWAAALMIVWANVHASYVIGLGLAAAFALEALVEEREFRRVITGWGLFGLAALAAAFVTPHGLQGFLYPFQVSGMRILPLISEWRPTRLPDDTPFVVLAAAVGGLAVWRWRRVGPVRLVLMAALLWLAIAHSRHQPVFAIVALMAIVPRAFERRGETERLDGTAVAVLAGAALVLVVGRTAVPYHRQDGTTYPASAIASVPAELRREPVINSYSFGGPLILAGVAPFIDGRSDMYGDDFTLAHHRIMGGDMPAFRAAARRWGIRWTIVHPYEPLAARLDREPGWRRAYADRWAVVHVRR